ncbi:MAG TPA: hypothetical protein VF209_03525 [Patescibacteria group bacterium]
MNKKWFASIIFWLALLTLGGFLLRFYSVGSNPSILNRDEAALAYNAYLLKEAGQDEWGRSWPLALESFGDYKLPGYPLLLLTFFTFLPLEDWVVRLPSVIAGTLLIPLSFFFAKRFKFSDSLSLLFAFIIALAPVFFFYSRIAFEANVGLALLVGALVLLLSRNRNQLFMDAIALILMVVAVFTYNTPLLLVPFVVPAVIFFRGWGNLRSWFIPVIGLSTIFVVVMSLLWPLTSQKSGITIFTDESTWSQWVSFRESLPASAQSSIGSRYFYWLGVMLVNFGQSFSPRFLITEGGTHPWHSLPNYGHTYFTVYILGIFGLLTLFPSFFTLFKCWVTNFDAGMKVAATRCAATLELIKPEMMLLYLLIVSLAPSVITVDSPHTTRSLFFIYIFYLLSIRGLAIAIEHLGKSKKAATILIVLFMGVMLLETSKYFYRYFYTFPTQQKKWFPGFQDAIQELERRFPHEEVAVVDGGGFHYILTAWYLKIPADQYLQTNVRQLPDRIGFRYGERVTHYHFIGHPEDRSHEKAMLLWEGTSWRIEP